MVGTKAIKLLENKIILDSFYLYKNILIICRYIMGCWRRSTKLSGGHLLEKTCHDFDIIGYILNKKPEKVASFGGLNFFNSKY